MSTSNPQEWARKEIDKMSKHTPEPWVVAQGRMYGQKYMVDILDKHPPEGQPWSLQARAVGAENATRIVECVNACQGIENPVVLLEIRRLMARLDKCIELGVKIEPNSSYHHDIRASLAALGVK